MLMMRGIVPIGTSFGVVGSSLIACATSCPRTTRPKMVCFPFRCAHAPTVMKNWEPLVSVPAPALAMPRTYGRSNLTEGVHSSAKLPPQHDSPPVPSPLGHPVWIIKPAITRWNPNPS